MHLQEQELQALLNAVSLPDAEFNAFMIQNTDTFSYKMIEDKNNLNKALTDSCNDLKNKVNDMEKSLEDYENILEKLKKYL